MICGQQGQRWVYLKQTLLLRLGEPACKMKSVGKEAVFRQHEWSDVASHWTECGKETQVYDCSISRCLTVGNHGIADGIKPAVQQQQSEAIITHMQNDPTHTIWEQKVMFAAPIKGWILCTAPKWHANLHMNWLQHFTDEMTIAYKKHIVMMRLQLSGLKSLNRLMEGRIGRLIEFGRTLALT